MTAALDIKRRTEFFIRDLHARENMRLGWYRQFGVGNEDIRQLRERKAHHIAFLRDLLRKRGLKPAWYSRLFYLIGHGFGLISGTFLQRKADSIERTLENWLLLRYKHYLEEMNLDAKMRSMVEALQFKRLSHNEPGEDAISLLEKYISEQKKVVDRVNEPDAASLTAV